MKIVSLLLFSLLLFFQIRFWVGDASLFKLLALKKEVKIQEEKILKLKERNQTLDAEVEDLKHHLSALEERARIDLGMIHQGEAFYQFPPSNEKE